MKAILFKDQAQNGSKYFTTNHFSFAVLVSNFFNITINVWHHYNGLVMFGLEKITVKNLRVNPDYLNKTNSSRKK